MMDFSINQPVPPIPQQDPRLLSSNYHNFGIKPPPIPPVACMPRPPFNLDLSIPQTTVIDMKTDDELFVETWLSKLGKINLNLDSTTVAVKTVKPKHPRIKGQLSIHQAKESLKKCLEITSQLEATQKLLKDNVATMSSDEWKKHTIAVGTLKDELTMHMSQFHNPELVKTLKYDLAQRAKKRATHKRKRTEMKLQRARQQEETHQQHKKIDLWLAAKQEEVERVKAAEIKQKDADCVLAGVTKKKTETRKQLSLLAALIKLHTVRETAVKARGEKIPEEDNAAFSKTTETLVTMWENSMKTYTKEEQNLKQTLEQNAKEDTQQTRANKEKEIAQQWDQVLFGPSYEPTPLYWALTAAQRDMEKFIAIRKSWDTFLTTDKQLGSKIPIGWVIPETNPSLEWSCYRQN